MDKILNNPLLSIKSKKYIQQYKYILRKKLYPKPAIRNNSKVFEKLKKRLLDRDTITPLIKGKLKREYQMKLLQKIYAVNTYQTIKVLIQKQIKCLHQDIRILDDFIELSIGCLDNIFHKTIYITIYEMYHNYSKRGFKLSKNRFKQQTKQDIVSNEIFVYCFNGILDEMNKNN